MNAIMQEPEAEPKARRNITLDSDLDDWLSSPDVDNASRLIQDLLMAYRAYGDATRAIAYVDEHHAEKDAEGR